MINSKLWLVVNPTVGLPLFLGAVAVSSFAVHLAVVSNTTWIEDYHSGREMGSTASIEGDVKTATLVPSGEGARVYRLSSTKDGLDEMVVVLPDGRMAKANFEQPVAMAPEPPAE